MDLRGSFRDTGEVGGGVGSIKIHCIQVKKILKNFKWKIKPLIKITMIYLFNKSTGVFLVIPYWQIFPLFLMLRDSQWRQWRVSVTCLASSSHFCSCSNTKTTLGELPERHISEPTASGGSQVGKHMSSYCSHLCTKMLESRNKVVGGGVFWLTVSELSPPQRGSHGQDGGSRSLWGVR